MFSYEGKRVLVTGAGRGIGRAIALAFAQHGADLTLVSRTLSQLESVAREARDGGGRAWVRQCDLSDPAEATSMVTEAAGEMGGLDVLVNNAGGAGEDWRGPLEHVTPEVFEAVYRLNLQSPFLAATAAVREMASRKTGGAILNISSIDGLAPAPGEALYGSAKAALISLTQSLAIESGRHGIRVNSIAPGLIETPLVSGWIQTEAERMERASYYPINRLGMPEDIAAAAIYLCSDEAGWVSGATLPVTGGQQAASDVFRWVRHHNPVPWGMKI